MGTKQSQPLQVLSNTDGSPAVPAPEGLRGWLLVYRGSNATFPDLWVCPCSRNQK